MASYLITFRRRCSVPPRSSLCHARQGTTVDFDCGKEQRLSSPPARNGKAGAFTLVEIVFAMGIMSFCMISMITLMTAGLTTMNDAGDAIARAQIIANVTSDVNATAFTQVATYIAGNGADAPLLFDKAGRELAKTDQADALFSATLSAETTSYPGSTAGSGMVQTVGVDIARLVPGTLRPIPQGNATIHMDVIVSK